MSDGWLQMSSYHVKSCWADNCGAIYQVSAVKRFGAMAAVGISILNWDSTSTSSIWHLLCCRLSTRHSVRSSWVSHSTLFTMKYLQRSFGISGLARSGLLGVRRRDKILEANCEKMKWKKWKSEKNNDWSCCGSVSVLLSTASASTCQIIANAWGCKDTMRLSVVHLSTVTTCCVVVMRLFNKLRAVRNAAARVAFLVSVDRVATETKKFDHITPVLREHHWLPVCLPSSWRHRI